MPHRNTELPNHLATYRHLCHHQQDLYSSLLDENVWVIEQPAQPALVIPTNAQGADRLFDAFVLLPNWNVEFTLSRLEDNQSHEDVIWQSNQYLDQSRYIH